MSKKKIVENQENINEVSELLSKENNYGLYTIVNNITGLSGSIMREPDDKTAYDRSLNDIKKIIENTEKCTDKLSNFSLIRLGVYNIETSTIISMDRLVMPYGDEQL